MKRLIAHEYVKAGHSDKNIFMERLFSEIFEATEFIITKGKEKWI